MEPGRREVVMTDEIDVEVVEEAVPAEVLAAELFERASSEGVSLVGPGGLLAELTRRVLEAGLEAELDEHLGYGPYDRAGHHSGNSRNGTRQKTVITEIGPVAIDVPRDRAGTFEPVLVPKRKRRLGGVDQMVLSLSAKGLTHGEIAAHLEEVYSTKVSKETISRITDSVIATMTEWQNRPLDRVYPVMFIDTGPCQDPRGPGREPADLRRRGGDRGRRTRHLGLVDRRRRRGRQVLIVGPRR